VVGQPMNDWVLVEGVGVGAKAIVVVEKSTN
jgi:hypothetical protein